MQPLKLLITIPPNADPTFDFQSAMVTHLETGLNLSHKGDGKWESDIGITMEVVEDNNAATTGV